MCHNIGIFYWHKSEYYLFHRSYTMEMLQYFGITLEISTSQKLFLTLSAYSMIVEIV